MNMNITKAWQNSNIIKNRNRGRRGYVTHHSGKRRTVKKHITINKCTVFIH